MVGQLILAEEFESGIASSLRLFVRLDVSAYYDNEAKAHKWFVNEVTRSHDTGLWLGETEEKNVDTRVQLTTFFAESLHYAVRERLFCKPPPQ